MPTNRFEGLMNAPAAKRCKSFFVTAADTEEVWLNRAPDAAEGNAPLCVWPGQDFAAALCDEPVLMEVHDFCEMLEENPERCIHVFPNGTDHTDLTAAALLERLAEELELLE